MDGSGHRQTLVTNCSNAGYEGLVELAHFFLFASLEPERTMKWHGPLLSIVAMAGTTPVAASAQTRVLGGVGHGWIDGA